MKEKMFKYFTANSTRKYIVILDEFVNSYNNTVHCSIKMTATEASKRENENQVWRNLYGDYSLPERKTLKFSVDDKVRITEKKGIFQKGYTPRWTEEVFVVSEVRYTEPITYKLKDLNGEVIKGSFYEQELQKTTQEMFRIEKVIRRKGDKSGDVWRNLYGDYSPPERKTPKFSVNDKVRITKKKSIFDKGYTPRWTEGVLQFQKFTTQNP